MSAARRQLPLSAWEGRESSCRLCRGELLSLLPWRRPLKQLRQQKRGDVGEEGLPQVSEIKSKQTSAATLYNSWEGALAVGGAEPHQGYPKDKSNQLRISGRSSAVRRFGA